MAANRNNLVLFKADVHVPTAETRRIAAELAALGLDEDEIAHVLSCATLDVRRYYADEVQFGLARVTALVGAKLVRKALSHDPDAFQAQKFFLQSRSGWVPTTRIQAGNKDEDVQVNRRDLLNSIIDSLAAAPQPTEAPRETVNAQGNPVNGG